MKLTVMLLDREVSGASLTSNFCDEQQTMRYECPSKTSCLQVEYSNDKT